MDQSLYRQLFSSKMVEIKKNEGMLEFYAKKTCRRCLGRGIIQWETPKGKSICQCVITALKKEIANMPKEASSG